MITLLIIWVLFQILFVIFFSYVDRKVKENTRKEIDNEVEFQNWMQA